MDKYNPKVSIVIPAYNASNYLGEAIDSALAQTYQNIEIIVVNDGSKDDNLTAKVAQKYGDKICYYEKDNGGSSSALNYGIQKMTGEWFSWLSHDDLYYPDKLKTEIEFLNRFSINFNNKEELQQHVIFAAANIIDCRGKIVKRISSRKLAKTDKIINSPNSNLYLISEPIQNGFHGCSCLIHRNVFDKIGMFSEKLFLLNDMDMWFRMYSKDYIIHYIPKALVKGRVHSKQVSRSIGFSYNNSEQDMFWSRNFEWLKSNYPNTYEPYYLFGRTAFLKTKNILGNNSFDIAINICPEKKLELIIKKHLYKIYAIFRNTIKRVYLKIRI